VLRFTRRGCLALLVLFAATWTFDISGQVAGPPKPILILVSFDAWRWDYFDRTKSPNLHALAARGVRSEGLIPAFPSKTFPNHYTIVTGLYPAHHGIVSNNMWDDAIGEKFTMSSATAKDPRWWAGEPLWVTAIKQGQRASSMFWPGAEVEIGGVRPTDWLPFDDSFPSADRVKQVLTWLSRPEAQRPQFITLYFSDVDTVGHTDGPNSQATIDAAERLDGQLGDLIAGIKARGLIDRTNIIIVSDHGMSQLALDRKIFLDDYVDLSTVNVVDWSPVLQIAPKTGTVDDLYKKLRGRHPALTVYRRDEVPADLHFAGNSRIQPIIALADDGWAITTRAKFAEANAKGDSRLTGGEHGYDGRFLSMHGLFVAAGPGVRQGAVIPEVENIHIYELMCRMLGLKPAKNDGDDRLVRQVLAR
jgi:predicted AlkP superfamily pyrophosphatase or phosphodiesterase